MKILKLSQNVGLVELLIKNDDDGLKALTRGSYNTSLRRRRNLTPAGNVCEAAPSLQKALFLLETKVHMCLPTE